ncbi:probable flavin-containing monoamine oxidase A, partial [Amphibalanus amphitrite]|uniref:probable flavin-containing monoamine oxidase A n=1 Tax=Amphibalanus amphitrite TaxID=1232801 RepID=UPI001C92B62C
MSASSETADEAPVMTSHTETNDVTRGSSDVTCEVLVIGAGISGLTAAYEIQKRNPKTELCLVEAKGRVGGRTLATQIRVREGQTETFDLGGQWVGSTQTDIMEMLDELGLEVYPQYIQGTKHMQLGGDSIRRYSSTIPNLGSWWGLVQLQLFIWKVDRLAKKCSPLSSCSDRTIRDLDGVSVEAFARQNISNMAALEAIIAACRVILGCDASRVSVVHFLAYTHAAGGLNALLEATPGTAQEFKVKGGTQQISELLADRIGRHRIFLGHPVTEITQGNDDVTVSTGDGVVFHCKYVISALPPNQLARVNFTPPLSPVRRELISNMPMGHLIKFVVTFEEAFWRAAGMSGEVVSNGGPSTVPGCTHGPLCIVYDATSDKCSPALVGFIAGSTSVGWESKR